MAVLCLPAISMQLPACIRHGRRYRSGFSPLMPVLTALVLATIS
jgi:hypothetical protein